MISAAANHAITERSRTTELWAWHHLTAHGIIHPKSLPGSFRQWELDGVNLKEQIKGGWTNLFLEYHGQEIARARHRWTDELKLEWDVLP